MVLNLVLIPPLGATGAALAAAVSSCWPGSASADTRPHRPPPAAADLPGTPRGRRGHGRRDAAHRPSAGARPHAGRPGVRRRAGRVRGAGLPRLALLRDLVRRSGDGGPKPPTFRRWRRVERRGRIPGLFVAPFGELGGSEMVLLRVIRALDERFEPHALILTPGGLPEREQAGVPTTRGDLPGKQALARMPALAQREARRLKPQRIAFIHANQAKAALRTFSSAWRAAADEARPCCEGIARAIAARCDRVVCVSRAMTQQFGPRPGRTGERGLSRRRDSRAVDARAGRPPRGVGGPARSRQGLGRAARGGCPPALARTRCPGHDRGPARPDVRARR